MKRGTDMKEYDVIVVGSGVGMNIVFNALSDGMKVALIDMGNVGGTCLNVGCVPSKMLVYPADRIVEIEEAKRLGLRIKIKEIDFSFIMGRMKVPTLQGRKFLKREIRSSKNLDFYNRETYFVDEYSLKVGTEIIKGRKIFIVSGSRITVPPVRGIEKIEYLTNESVLELKKRPGSMIIIGGGYVAAEYAHFFAAMGTKVTIVETGERLLRFEEPEVSELLKKALSKRMKIYTNTETLEVRKVRNGCVVTISDKSSGKVRKMTAERIMVAAGRKSNADLLRVENTGIETDAHHYISVDAFLRTNKENIWALGDAIGKQMFTHAGDKEAEIAWHNATNSEKMAMDFNAVPHAVFTSPQIASVGITEEAAKKDHEILVGKAHYSDTVAGDTMAEKEGFAKAVVDKKTRRILGFHIIGPYAPMLIQEVVNAVANKSDIKYITGSMHIFPALSELIPETLNSLK
jgi:dihydrolipoamide dehydrogenase